MPAYYPIQNNLGATYNGYVYGPTVLRILELTQPQPPTDAEIAANPQLKRNDTTGWTTAVRPWQVHGHVHVHHGVQVGGCMCERTGVDGYCVYAHAFGKNSLKNSMHVPNRDIIICSFGCNPSTCIDSNFCQQYYVHCSLSFVSSLSSCCFSTQYYCCTTPSAGPRARLALVDARAHRADWSIVLRSQALGARTHISGASYIRGESDGPHHATHFWLRASSERPISGCSKGGKLAPEGTH